MVQDARPSEDARTLVQKFRRHGRHDEPYADTTRDCLSHIRRRWTSFCLEAALGEPTEALQNATAAEYKAFFQWFINNSERSPPQAPTLKQYFRLLKMLYRQNTGTVVDDQVVRDVNVFIKHYAEGTKKTSPRQKPVAAGEDVVRMLHYLYKTDRALYPDERSRVQQGFLIIVHAFSGLRPSSTTKTSTKQGKDKASVDEGQSDKPLCETDELVKLRYGDVEIVLTGDEQGRTRFAIRPTFTYFKGNLKRAQHKTFTWFDQADVLTCPVAHLVALASFDKAFALPDLFDLEKFFALTAPCGKSLVLPWRSDILDTPILRESRNIASGELPGSIALRRLTTLGKNMGYRQTITWYCFRRLVLNAVDGFGSEEVRNQIAGHLESQTYRNSYQNQRIELDVPGLVLNQAPEDNALIKKMGLMGADIDPAANIALSSEVHDQIAALSDVEALRKEYDTAAELVRQKYGGLQSAPESDPHVRDWRQKQRRLRAKKEFYRSQMKSRLREDYFEQKDVALIEAQLHKSAVESPQPDAPTAWIPLMPERAELASLDSGVDIRAADMLKSRVSAVCAMASLCRRIERTKRSATEPLAASSNLKTDEVETDVSEKADVGETFPMRCDELQCLFCIGDEDLVFDDRVRKFRRLQILWGHARAHLDELPNSEIPCPHPQCCTRGVMLNSVEHLLNHAQREHNIRLRSR